MKENFSKRNFERLIPFWGIFGKEMNHKNFHKENKNAKN